MRAQKLVFLAALTLSSWGQLSAQDAEIELSDAESLLFMSQAMRQQAFGSVAADIRHAHSGSRRSARWNLAPRFGTGKVLSTLWVAVLTRSMIISLDPRRAASLSCRVAIFC